MKRLDDLARKLVFERDGHKCQKCGSKKDLGVSHFVRRSNLMTRWYLPNLTTLCNWCHSIFEVERNFHSHWMTQRMGKEAVLALVERGKQRIPTSKNLWMRRVEDELRGNGEAGQ